MKTTKLSIPTFLSSETWEQIKTDLQNHLTSGDYLTDDFNKKYKETDLYIVLSKPLCRDGKVYFYYIDIINIPKKAQKTELEDALIIRFLEQGLEE